MKVILIAALLVCALDGIVKVQGQPFPFPDLPNVAFTAKELCSGLWVSGLDEEKVINEDLDFAKYFIDFYVDRVEKSVVSIIRDGSFPPQKAIYREDVGCTLVTGLTEEEIRDQDLGDQTPLPPLDETVAWPYGEYVDPTPPLGVDMKALQEVVDKDFGNPVFNTRAIIVVYNGRIILEQYAPGITKKNRLLGYSMTKSITSTLIGMLIGEGRLSLKQKAPIKEWSNPQDPRNNITIENLLHMSSGLDWNEDRDAGLCLYVSQGDCAQFTLERSLKDEINSQFEYSTGTTTLLSRIVAENRGLSELTNFEYARKQLFEKINIQTGIIEPQAAGYPLGGSHGYLTPRDWARFGQLFMNDGVWNGKRILPEGWVKYAITPSSTYEGYGAQWWIEKIPVPDLYFMAGFRNQHVFNMPSKNLTVVRNSMPSTLQSGLWNRVAFLTPLVACFP